MREEVDARRGRRRKKETMKKMVDVDRLDERGIKVTKRG